MDSYSVSAHGEDSSASLPAILLVENDEADIFLFRRALSKMGCVCRVYAVHTLCEARSYLENTGNFTNKDYYQQPKLIVSDFKLIGETALDFLRWLSGHPTYAQIPFVILSGVASQMDPEKLREFEICSILTKTPDVATLCDLLRPVLPPGAALG